MPFPIIRWRRVHMIVALATMVGAVADGSCAGVTAEVAGDAAGIFGSAAAAVSTGFE